MKKMILFYHSLLYPHLSNPQVHFSQDDAYEPVRDAGQVGARAGVRGRQLREVHGRHAGDGEHADVRVAGGGEGPERAPAVGSHQAGTAAEKFQR